MQLRRISLSREHLEAIPEADRQLFVLVGHALNEVNTLDKLAYLSSLAQEATVDWMQTANSAQTFILVRVLAGKLNEAWEGMQKSYFKTRLSTLYDDHLSESEAAALKRLKKYFGRSKESLNKSSAS